MLFSYNQRVVGSFSGGRTSGELMALLKAQYPDLLVLFVNTAQEDPRTLQFVDQCDKHFGLNVVWLEAVVDPRPRKGTSFRIVTYETASRAGEPFEAMIAKYGLPNKNYPHCTRELKLRPMEAYMRHLGWERGSWVTAVGIRADELDRQRADAKEVGLVYPLIDLGITKEDVLAFWHNQPFDLYLPEHLGNCVWCWKKSDRKLMTVAVNYMDVFDFPLAVEELYAEAGAGEGPRRLFRGQRTAREVIARAMVEDFEMFVDGNEAFDPDLDEPGGCEETCEVY